MTPLAAPRPPFGVAPSGGGVIGDAEAVELLRRVVATPSLSGEEGAVAALLVAAAGRGAARAEVDAAGNAVATWGAGPLAVTFLGHMDTVPGTIPVRVVDGVLQGRGVVDAKGSLCAALVAATRVGPAVWERLTFRLVGAVEEEAASSRGARHAVASLPAPDLVIVGEPSGWERYTLGYKGRLGVTVTARRPSAHSSREEPSPAEVVLDAYAALREWVGRDNAAASEVGEAPPLFDRLQVALLGVDSGSDGLEEWCEARIGLRLPPRWAGAALVAALDDLLRAAGVTASFTEACDAHRASNRSVLARAFRVAIRTFDGRPTPTLKTGTSDMNVVAPSWDVPMVAYGPGDSSLDHTPEERLPLGEYLLAVDVLERVLTELAGA